MGWTELTVTDGCLSRRFQEPLTERYLQQRAGAGAAAGGLTARPLLSAPSHAKVRKQELLEVAEMKPMFSPNYNKKMCWGERADIIVQIGLKR